MVLTAGGYDVTMVLIAVKRYFSYLGTIGKWL